jgi:thiol-disulfide isomerase/thioredoxin
MSLISSPIWRAATRFTYSPRFTPVFLLLTIVVFAIPAANAPGADNRIARVVAVPAPSLTGDSWLNVPKEANANLLPRKGKVSVVHFWTFGCVNCKRNLPFYQQWQQRFAGKGLEILGVHTPETDDERSTAKVIRKVKELGITYPVLIDQDSQNWKRWQQRCWPTVYLVDKQGRVRFAWEGELEYQGAGGNAKMIALIESLLNE